MQDSASVTMLAIMLTAASGNWPLADSPDSITQSAPSRIAFATSLASALVGRGLVIIDSSIWVATITGLPNQLHLSIMYFWARKTFSVGISIPRSPLATIIPSDVFMISSKFSRPSWFSILLIILIWAPLTPSTSLIYSTSLAFLINEAAMISILFLIPNSTK